MKTRASDTATIEEVDPRITYPCYKSFDEFVDVERLKSLNGYITERIKKHIEEQKDDYFLNAHRLETESAEKPGSREIWLTRIKPGVAYNYLDLYQPELWQWA